MPWLETPKKWPWRDFLTEEEADKVRELEQLIEVAHQAGSNASQALDPIRNRAIHRAKRAAT